MRSDWPGICLNRYAASFGKKINEQGEDRTDTSELGSLSTLLELCRVIFGSVIEVRDKNVG